MLVWFWFEVTLFLWVVKKWSSGKNNFLLLKKWSSGTIIFLRLISHLFWLRYPISSCSSLERTTGTKYSWTSHSPILLIHWLYVLISLANDDDEKHEELVKGRIVLLVTVSFKFFPTVWLLSYRSIRCSQKEWDIHAFIISAIILILQSILVSVQFLWAHNVFFPLLYWNIEEGVFDWNSLKFENCDIFCAFTLC